MSTLLGEQIAEPTVRIRTLLESARHHLGMDIAFLGELQGGYELYRAVAGDADSFYLSEGLALPAAQTYCEPMMEGRIDNVVADTSLEPAVATLIATTVANIGRFIGVPVVLPNGRVYGALCGMGHTPDPELRTQDARLLAFVAELVAEELAHEDQTSKLKAELTSMVTPLLDGTGLTMAFQPIVDLSSGAVAGFEALARFSVEPLRSPDAWFSDAERAGLGVELEMAAVHSALESLNHMPEPGHTYLSINASAETACSAALALALSGIDLTRVVLEITEHAAVKNYEELNATLLPFRARGMRLAVDDAGAGVASLHHILELAPEIIKMDISLTRGIDVGPARAALATALVTFGRETGAAILAEGIETPAEFDTLRRLGLSYGQGYLLGRPGPLPDRSVIRPHRAMLNNGSSPRRVAQPIGVKHR